MAIRKTLSHDDRKVTWYTYELVDPTNGEIFYVGKGKGKRAQQHSLLAKRGRPSPKYDKIREMLSRGVELITVKLKEFADEKAAYAHEKEHIAQLGLHRLANVTAGGGSPKAMTFEQKMERYGTRWAAADILMRYIYVVPKENRETIKAIWKARGAYAPA